MCVVIEPLADGAWQALRDLRLEALREAPDAFWATWDDERKFGVQEWTRFERSVAWFVASRDGHRIGLVGAVQRDDCAEEREVIGMWVRPTERRSRVAELLLDAVSRWATTQGAAVLTLWVTHANHTARTFYLRHGFTLTGEEAPMPGGRTGSELRMHRVLGVSSAGQPSADGRRSLDGVPRRLRDLAAAALDRASNDPRCVGLVLGGSAARGAADEYSDLDLLIVCDDETHLEVLDGARDFASSLGPLLAAFPGDHLGEPRLLIALFDPGPRHVDLKFVSMRELDERVEDGVVLWQQDDLVDRAYERRPASWPTADPQWIEDRFWVWLHYASVKIARGELFEAVDTLTYIRSTALAPLISAGRITNPVGVRRIEQIAPDLLPALNRTIADATVPGCLRAAEATVDLYLDLRVPERIEHRDAAERSTRAYLSSLIPSSRREGEPRSPTNRPPARHDERTRPAHPTRSSLGPDR